MQGEHVLGALPVQWHRNLFSITPWTIVVTDARIIVARLTPKIQKQAVDAKVQEQGGGFLKRMAAATTSGFTLHERYLTMDPEAVLTETPEENWWVDARGVSQVTVTQGGWISDRDGHRKQDDHHLVIVTQQGKFSYTFTRMMNAVDAANLLAQVFGATVKLR